jgi:aminopeptidase N
MQNLKPGKPGRKQIPLLAVSIILMLMLVGCQAAPEITATPFIEITADAVVSPTAQVTLTPLPATAVPTPTSVNTVVPPAVEGIGGDRSLGDAYIPELGNTGYDVQQYTLRLALDPSRVYVDGHVTVEAVTTIQNIAQISLDFIGYEIEELTLDGSPVDYVREGRKLVVDFPEPLPVGEAFALDVIYHGMPVFEQSPYVPFISHLGLQFPENGQNGSLYAISEPDGARYWYPCNDHPRDKAIFRFELGVPEGLLGAANGVLLDSREGVPAVFEDGTDGDIFVWEHNHPMATYLATVVVGEYELLQSRSPDGIALRHAVFPHQVGSFTAQEETIGEMVDWMSDLLIPYPFEIFGFASVSGLGASLEKQTLVILDERAGEYTMAHELAHMWFGNWVSLDSWGDMWRNEGFATYLGAMWSRRDQPGGLEQYMDEVAESYRGYVPQYPLNQPPPRALFGRDSYMRGALLVHELRGVMGDEAFFDGLRQYLERFGGATATHAQFQSVMEAAAGIDLDAFFKDWFR